MWHGPDTIVCGASGKSGLTMTLKNKASWISAMMIKVEVYSGFVHVGCGYGFRIGKEVFEPTLMNNEGTPLEQGYYTLLPVEDEQLVVVSLTKQ